MQNSWFGTKYTLWHVLGKELFNVSWEVLFRCKDVLPDRDSFCIRDGMAHFRQSQQLVVQAVQKENEKVPKNIKNVFMSNLTIV